MVHYKMLKFYFKMGKKLTKIQIIINYKQNYICTDYIQSNLDKTATAKSEAAKDKRN